MLRQLVLGSIALVSASCATNDQAPVATAAVAKTAVTGEAPSRERIAVQPESGPAVQSRAQSLGVLPATFKGDLPCADCSAIQYQLDLFADNSYDLLLIHRGKAGSSVNQSGRWEKAGINSISLLGGSTKIQLAIVSTNALRLLNQNGGAIDSNLNYTLTRDTQTPNAELLNTPWRLTRLIDQPARRFPNQREPQIVLGSDGLVTGSDGCNRITGGYQRAEARLTFTQIAATRMACMNGMDQAGRFTNALGSVARYHINGRHLELFDSTEALLLRFEAVFVR
jgi:heat shock protein HslJ